MAKWNEQQFIDQNRGEFVHEENLKDTVEEQDKRDSGQDTSISNNKTEADANKEKNVEQDADLAALKKEADANRDQNTVQDGEISKNKAEADVNQQTNTTQDGEIKQINSQLSILLNAMQNLAMTAGGAVESTVLTPTKFNSIDLTNSANGNAAATVSAQNIFDIKMAPMEHLFRKMELRAEFNLFNAKGQLLDSGGAITVDFSTAIPNAIVGTAVPVTLYASDGTHTFSVMSTAKFTTDLDKQTASMVLQPMMDKLGEPTQFATFLANILNQSTAVDMQVYCTWFANRTQPYSGASVVPGVSGVSGNKN